jgi:HAD superfamily hydrolase (TIGR01490 family)
MKSHKAYIAFFDLDRTMISLNSGSTLVKMARDKGLMTPLDIIKAIIQVIRYRLRLRKPKRIISDIGKWLKGMSVESFSVLAMDTVNKYLIGSIYPDVYREIDLHKSNNAELAILSSSIEQICKPIATHLGFDMTICTEMESNDGILTGLPSGAYCYGEEKRNRIITFCNTFNYDPASAYYYGDSISDLPALDYVGNPVCVNPDKDLRRVAHLRGWRICDWKKYFKNKSVNIPV